MIIYDGSISFLTKNLKVKVSLSKSEIFEI